MANESTNSISLPAPAAAQEGRSTMRIKKAFCWIIRCILLMSLLTVGYWLFSSVTRFNQFSLCIFFCLVANARHDQKCGCSVK